jgi:hypothetical protein
MELAGHEGWIVSGLLIVLPFVILGVLMRFFLPPGRGHAPELSPKAVDTREAVSASA